MDYTQLAEKLVDHLGGEENIRSLVHCTTRLRFKLVQIDKADKMAIENLEGVIQVMVIAGQFQIVIGNEVHEVYRAIQQITAIDDNQSKNAEQADHERLIDKAIDIVSGIFTPLLGAMAGAGILKGLLIIAEASELLTESDGTYQIFHAASDSLFYFLPMLLAFTASKKFETDPYVAVVIAGALLYPDIVEVYNQGEALSVFGIPVILTNYAMSIIPIILAVYVASQLEPILNRILPSVMKTFFTPLVLIALMVPMTLVVFGPFGTYVSDWIAQGYLFIYENSAMFAGAFIGFFWQILVIFGLHWGITPIALNNISNFGTDTFTAMLTPAIFGQAGAAMGVWLKTKRDKVKSIAAPATVSGIFGVTEPAIYGVTLRYKKPFFIGCTAGAIGGAVVGFSGAASHSVAIPGVTTLPVFFGDGFFLFIVAVVGTFVFAGVATYMFGFHDEQVEELTGEKEQEYDKQSENLINDRVVYSPLEGAVVPLEEVNDPVFSSGAIGVGLAIIPIDGHVYSPVNGTVQAVYPARHAISISSDAGMEILIHIGIETVQLDGKYFAIDVTEGAHIHQGELLGTFDLQQMTKQGYDMMSPIVVTNDDQYLDVIQTSNENVASGDRLLTAVK
ncbi:PTS system beta-glucoside-specific transporter subunits IIABC [Gracilibacillus halophilus YIM-C55.5]|uniref:PTS system beta-glucoside-specific transporter subunits IIABC n=1 Tax=Gracilibacillus halophilus YIM-C55.5 TaxID=1308866 RepID=N4WT25_9BACI|nr:beta-glucoside-specific PTS transporter subunit IIABC [Gracilibacillus halophilus]ENH96321.1 PTS system beta-glucoside-specific transporter subunits IIABC [Gracilibacillus halophilus YIM-C55.5]